MVWSESSWWMWLKNRLDEMGKFCVEANNGSIPVKFKTLMHIFFLSIEETEEHLEKLRTEPKKDAKSARGSKIFATNKIPKPIDRIASKGIKR